MRRHPTATFGIIGGLFALAFFLAVSTRELLSGTSVPSVGEAIIVVGGFAGGFALFVGGIAAHPLRVYIKRGPWYRDARKGYQSP
ncbi:hypothetical protein C474_02506 [Halogeometricum pallidum JCM 14848]|uniref:Uncharacterized protein n=1 Tax=Halogeometricum pallidum JCM 14848 TaxID=1227487 RepID=M0DGG9_HALPD|nr:hypothetical protein [Halogeometricum pallidum]ELZ34540.1 hypothetical protein C474_02506 [Halogeometricum pallidum JCM 14848]